MKKILEIAIGSFIGLTGASIAMAVIGFSKPVTNFVCRKSTEIYKEMYEELE